MSRTYWATSARSWSVVRGHTRKWKLIFTVRVAHSTTICKEKHEALRPLTTVQRAKKVVSDSPGLVDFAVGLVNSVFNLPDGQVMFYEEFE